MTYKNIIKFNLLSLSLMFITSCSEPVTPPEVIAQNYYQNLIRGNAEESYLFLSSEDKNNSTLADFKSSVFFDIGGEVNVSTDDFLDRDELGFGKLLMSLSAVDVVNVTTLKDSSIVEVSPEVIDYDLVFAQLYEKLFSDFLSMDDLNDSQKTNKASQIFNELNKSELPRKKLENLKINLKKEESGWTVFIDINNLINLRNQKIIEQQKEEKRLAEEKIKEEERLRAEKEKLEKEKEAKRIAEEVEYKKSTINISVNKDDFTDDVSSISMIFLPSKEEGSYRPKTLALVKYIDSSHAVVLMNQDYSIDDKVSVKLRFDDNQMFRAFFSRTSDNIFNSDKRFFYEFLRNLENTNQLLVGVDGEGSFKTSEYFYLEEKYKEFLCLIDKYDSAGVDESQLELFPTRYYRYNKADCDF